MLLFRQVKFAVQRCYTLLYCKKQFQHSTVIHNTVLQETLPGQYHNTKYGPESDSSRTVSLYTIL